MIVIEIPYASRIALWGPYPELRDWREPLARFRPGAQYTKAFQNGNWDGKDRPGRFKKIDGRWSLQLSRGWFDRVRASWPDAEVVYGEHYRPDPLALALDVPDEFSDRYDYQFRTLQLMQERRWGRIACATNAGKGAVMAVASRNAAARTRTLVLADEISVYQALEGELAEWAPDVDVGLVKAGVDDPPDAEVVLAMVQTTYGRLDDPEWRDYLADFGMVLADEADRATAKMWTTILDACPNSEYRFGFSGSFPEPEVFEEEGGEQLVEAEHAEGRLEGLLGPTLIRVKNRTLVRRGISVKPIVELIPNRIPRVSVPDDLEGPAARAYVYREAIHENRIRHEKVRSVLDEGLPNVVIVDKIAHGEALNEFIPDSVFLHGSHSDDERLEVMEAFRRGDFPVLIATRILDRGTNLLGHAVGIVIASGEGSHRQILQRVGRGLRKAEGKEFVYLRDIVDRGHRYLDKASRKRVRVYDDEGFEISVRKE